MTTQNTNTERMSAQAEDTDAQFEATLGRLIGRYVLALRGLKDFLRSHPEFSSALTVLNLD